MKINYGISLTNISNQLYVMAIPNDYGGSVYFEYFITNVTDPNLILNPPKSIQQASTSVAVSTSVFDT